jgi:RHS repeat-associated protein
MIFIPFCYGSPFRIQHENAHYHVTCNENGHQQILTNGEDHSGLIDPLNRSRRIYQVAVLAYVLMRNHFHLLVKTALANPKEFMRHCHFYDNEDIIMEYNRKGKVTARYVHGLGIDEPLALEENKQINYYRADGLGSIMALTDKRGRVIQTYEYDSFGGMRLHWNPIKQPYTYTAREWDEEIELYYYRARYYDPKAGRFISKDPIGFAGGDVNLYRYAQNNPIISADPLGLEPPTPAQLGLPPETNIPLGTPGGPRPQIAPNIAPLLNMGVDQMLLMGAGELSREISRKLEEYLQTAGCEKIVIRICFEKNHPIGTVFVIRAGVGELPLDPKHVCGPPLAEEGKSNCPPPCK